MTWDHEDAKREFLSRLDEDLERLKESKENLAEPVAERGEIGWDKALQRLRGHDLPKTHDARKRFFSAIYEVLSEEFQKRGLAGPFDYRVLADVQSRSAGRHAPTPDQAHHGLYPLREDWSRSLLAHAPHQDLIRALVAAPGMSLTDAAYLNILKALATFASVQQQPLPAEYVRPAEPMVWDLKDQTAECELAILLITADHVAGEAADSYSVLVPLATHLADEGVPVFVYALPGAEDIAVRQRSEVRKQDSVIDRLATMPLSGTAPICFRVAHAESVEAVADDLVKMISKLARGAVFFVQNMSKVAWNDLRLEELERGAKEIWIFTPTFYFELDSLVWSKLTTDIIRRGAKYRWLYPVAASDRAEQLYEKVLSEASGGPHEAQVEFFWLPDDEVPWWPEVAIYEPTEADNRRAFLYGIWWEEAPQAIDCNYKLMPNTAERISREFDDLCKNSLPLGST